jgi:hypothetical protein
LRSEFRDPTIFPCQVVGCEVHADGWVLTELVEWMELRVESASERVFLCATHLRPLRVAPSDS